MPFSSERQRRFLWVKHPQMARRWEAEARAKAEPVVQPRKKSGALRKTKKRH